MDRVRRVRLISGWLPVTVKSQIFVKGQVIKTVPEAKIVETLIEEALQIAHSSSDGSTPAANVDRSRRQRHRGWRSQRTHPSS